MQSTKSVVVRVRVRVQVRLSVRLSVRVRVRVSVRIAVDIGKLLIMKKANVNAINKVSGG